MVRGEFKSWNSSMSFAKIAGACLALVAITASVDLANARTQAYPVGDVSHVRAPQSVFTETDYFPYADRRLFKMKEPSLWKMSRDPNNRAFRFLWVPVSGQVLLIRIDFEGPDKASLTTSRSTGIEDEDWGEVTDLRTIELTDEQIELFEYRFNRLDYWYLEREQETEEEVGDLWLFEGAEYGKYHAVPRVKPAEGLIYDFELFLVRFSGLDQSIVTGATATATVE